MGHRFRHFFYLLIFKLYFTLLWFLSLFGHVLFLLWLGALKVGNDLGLEYKEQQAGTLEGGSRITKFVLYEWEMGTLQNYDVPMN